MTWWWKGYTYEWPITNHMQSTFVDEVVGTLGHDHCKGNTIWVYRSAKIDHNRILRYNEGMKERFTLPLLPLLA